MSKRQKFVLTSFLLGSGMLLVKSFNIESSSFVFLYEIFVGLILVTIVLSIWSLRESMRFDSTALTVILPILFTAGTAFFYFYLVKPGSFLEKIPIVPIAYVIGMYATLLGSNIYAIASLRTIALLRTAHAVGFLLTLVAAFFLFDTLLSFNSYPWINALLAVLITFPLVLQSLWSIELTDEVSPAALNLAIVTSVVAGELIFVISFWPITVTVGSLFLTTALYVILGIMQASLQGRLFRKTLREYMIVGIIVFVAAYLSSKWGG